MRIKNTFQPEFPGSGFAGGCESLHIFLVGPGLVGGRLLEQIEQQADVLREEHGLEIRVNAIANSKQMIFAHEGIALAKWRRILQQSTEATDFTKFVQEMKRLNLNNSVFVDCTASEAPVIYYEQILGQCASIVTANKKANSASFKQYVSLKEAAKEAGVRFYYETNVGAGLPVINTLKDLTLSGDKIVKIEAIISGTIAFLFNAFDGTKPFSALVKEAKALGYTEPDPREDLNGMDAARKLLILAREAGVSLEFADLSLENILPESCKQAASVGAFFAALEAVDSYFEKLRKKAADQGKRLRYIAAFSNGKAEISLQEVDANHPFFYLQGSENIISITTSRYCDAPLVIKGPGAGADLTAAGVFADILRTAKI